MKINNKEYKIENMDDLTKAIRESKQGSIVDYTSLNIPATVADLLYNILIDNNYTLKLNPYGDSTDRINYDANFNYSQFSYSDNKSSNFYIFSDFEFYQFLSKYIFSELPFIEYKMSYNDIQSCFNIFQYKIYNGCNEQL
jgi:hypothetical protein